MARAHEIRRHRTRVGVFARVPRCALPAFSVRAPTQDRGASIAGSEVLLVDGDSSCATVRATGHEPHRLAAVHADAHDPVDARDSLLRADRDGRELARKQRTEERLGGSTQLLARHLGCREDLEPVLHAPGVARTDRTPRALARARPLGALAGRRARMRDVPRNGDLDTAVAAAREPVGAVGPGEIEGRPVGPCGSTRSLAPDRGGDRPILEAARQTSTLAGRHAERERKDCDEPDELLCARNQDRHAAEPSAVRRAAIVAIEKPSIGPFGPDPYNHGRT